MERCRPREPATWPRYRAEIMTPPHAQDDGSGTVTIPAHFHGPPESGNGGYTCGLAAVALGTAPAQVRLRIPPPLDRPLQVEQRGDLGVLLDGDDVVAEVRPADLDLDTPSPISFEAATDALGRFDVGAYAAEHAFPTCFTCGPHRAPGDGLRIFPAPVDGRPDLVVGPWVPDGSDADDDGLIRDEIVWAALDCQSGLVWILGDPPTGAAVLGQLAVSIVRRPSPGEELVVAGWRTDADGRKCHSGSAVWTADGDLIAKGQAIWIRLADDQHETFNTATR